MTQHPSAPGSVENHPLKVVEPFFGHFLDRKNQRASFWWKVLWEKF